MDVVETSGASKARAIRAPQILRKEGETDMSDIILKEDYEKLKKEGEPMNDSISRQALINTFESWLRVPDYNDKERYMIKAALYEVETAPPARDGALEELSAAVREISERLKKDFSDYKGCANCRHQPEPLRMCKWGEKWQCVELICSGWEKKEKDGER
jgi:hypothetical protein